MVREPNTRERRRMKRRSLFYYMKVLDPQTLQPIGHLVDINGIGLMIDSQTSFLPGRELQLRLDTTRDLAEKAYILIRATVRWCKPDSVEPTLYDVGLEITSISAHDAEIIQKIIELYCKPESTFNFG
jgi:hypothetical protein